MYLLMVSFKNLLHPVSPMLPVAGEAGQVSCCCIAAVRLEPAAIWGDSRRTNPHTSIHSKRTYCLPRACLSQGQNLDKSHNGFMEF